MAIRKSKQESFEINGKIEEIRQRVERALSNGNFTSIITNNLLNHITGNYKKFSVWGEIKITLSENHEKTKIDIVSTANSDNIFALFSSPNDKILSAFKDNFK
ncbi:hypothetical protein [Flavobacterium gilvum]|uniref:Uncharacterized protein n=1 Tax=Flavobacterium gilvum TaxID=1492737 RepID=A0AAC9I6M0_9FLAO|nr:hypothetical protein [Flavobacterium gilvum]AOW09903.1 hypothetical protein EM308_10500 [Flavobacterium gilvum]KFC57580.1 hypothetical protein FEM08_36430 [Flavobacterium gilvum]